MISICYVGFASLRVVYDELNDCAWNVGLLVCISFLISVCMFIVSKALLISSFRCRRCDGTIQEADPGEDLMVEGETYGCVHRFVI